MQMQIAATIDALIVLFSLYLGLSLLVSHFNELLASIVKLRGMTLYDGILNLLCGARDFADAIMLHPMIASTQHDKTGVIDPNESYRPSYIDPRSFSTALWQSLAVATYQPNRQVATISFTNPAAAPATFIATLRTSVARVPNGQLRLQLYALLEASQGDYQKLLAATDDWFNRQMDRVSGWYQRRSRFIAGVMALVLVSFLGVDTFRVADAAYRQVPPSAITAVTSAVLNAPVPSPSATPSAAQMQAVAQLLTSDQLMSAIIDPWPPKWQLQHIAGLIVTFLAVLLGAPFWFDALSNISNVRLSGPKPDQAATPSTKP